MAKRKLEMFLTPKQLDAWEYLGDDIHTEVLYGGSAGSGKSALGCFWLIRNAYEYPGTRGMMGRVVLKHLKQSTLLSFFDVCRTLGLESGRDYHYHIQGGYIIFNQTGSKIYLKDLAYYPSDPEYDSLGSTEYSYAFIDEASQMNVKVRDVVKSRIRYKIKEFNIKPKLLMTCNPSKNFLYSDFYKPWKEGDLRQDRAFVPALPGDNPFLPADYIENLKGLDKITQERLLYGNWEYDDDPSTLVDIDAINDLFTNQVEGQPVDEGDEDKRELYLVADIARFGSDRTVISLWKGLECFRLEVFKKQSLLVTAKLVEQRAKEFNIRYSNILIDEDGIGGGVMDSLKGVKGFMANQKPFRDENYNNLRSQCAFSLAQAVRDRRISIKTGNEDLKAQIVAEFETLKQKDPDKDGKLSLIGKDRMKNVLGRSPDLLDVCIMRMWFEFRPVPKLSFL